MMNLTTLIRPTWVGGDERGHTMTFEVFDLLNYNRWHCPEQDADLFPKDRAAKLMNLKLVTR